MDIPKDYEMKFIKAYLTFKFQMVYDPVKKMMVHLNDPATHPNGPDLQIFSDKTFLGSRLN